MTSANVILHSLISYMRLNFTYISDVKRESTSAFRQLYSQKVNKPRLGKSVTYLITIFLSVSALLNLECIIKFIFRANYKHRNRVKSIRERRQKHRFFFWFNNNQCFCTNEITEVMKILAQIYDKYAKATVSLLERDYYQMFSFFRADFRIFILGIRMI